MLDFLIKTKDDKHKKISCTFRSTRRKDLMTKGGKFEAFYDDKTGMWSTDMDELCIRVDEEIDEKLREVNSANSGYLAEYMSVYNTGILKSFINFVKDVPDKFDTLDKRVIFANEETTREDYCAHKVDYILEEGDCSAWDKLIGTLYGPEDREKFEWAIGALISGKSRNIQKAIFVEGQPGRGKSTIFDIMQEMMPYHSNAFVAEDLGNESKQFAASAFAKNPLFAIDADAKLFNISATNRMNQIISHDKTLINEKFKAPYPMRITTMLFMASNDHLDINSSRSGLMRRIILIKPSGHTLPRVEYDELRERIKFEYGAIAYHCLEVFNSLGESYYDDLRDKRLLDGSNETYKFLKELYFEINNEPYVTVNSLWLKFRQWLEQNNTTQVLHRKIDFENDIINYFEHYSDRKYGTYKVLEGFKTYMFEFNTYEDNKEANNKLPEWLWLKNDIPVNDNVINKAYSDCLAQEANDADHPSQKWDKVKTTLNDIDTTKVHYVLPPEKHIVIDFDLKDAEGNKNLDLNLEAAKIFPETYVEVSKGGQGLHLHYIYDGDIDELASLYSEHIEILSFKGKKALRRKVYFCNNHEIAILREGQLPKKEVKDVAINSDIVITEQGIRKTIAKCLMKQVHGDTTSNVNFILDILDKAYASGIDYDVSDLHQKILTFATNSSNQSIANIKKVGKMHFKCKRFEEAEKNLESTNTAVFAEDAPIVFFDIEIFPNLFVICWKLKGADDVVTWINPSAEQIRQLFKYRLIGFNNRDYDNHIIYAASMGYSIDGLYKLSQNIINGDPNLKKNSKFGEAYNISYTDIYDFASAGNKMSLKKWEIKLGIRHLELGLPWDQPVPEDLWDKVGEYCCNDVTSTEALFEHLQGDFAARLILSKISGLTPNDTTNQHTTKILCGDKKNPQAEYVYTDLSTIFPGYEFKQFGFNQEDYIPGCKIISGKSRYMGEDPGEGGYKIANYGYYENVGLLDIASMHPSSAIALNVFGDEITARFKALVDGRVEVKHIREFGDEHYLKALDILGALGEFVVGVIDGYFNEGRDAGETAKALAKNLANALKTAINSVYGLTSAAFPNKLKDPRNKDNIVAKRGALFMLTLKHKLIDMGVTIVHISTDSIKIANITPEIISFVMDFGKQYGYTFEHEATYSKMCIINDAVYIAEEVEADGKPCEPFWTATGKQFQVPFVFKTLFSHEDITFDDLCETMSTTSALYLAQEIGDTGTMDYHFVGKVGQFTPVISEVDGCELLRLSGEDADGNPKFAAATGSKGYLWLESEVVRTIFIDPMSVVDMSYYHNLADKAAEAIEEYVPFDIFVNSR